MNRFLVECTFTFYRNSKTDEFWDLNLSGFAVYRQHTAGFQFLVNVFQAGIMVGLQENSIVFCFVMFSLWKTAYRLRAWI